MSEIRTLTDGSNGVEIDVAPRTLVEAIKDNNNSTLTSILASKQNVLVFNTAYDPTTNKVATMADINASIVSAIEGSY